MGSVSPSELSALLRQRFHHSGFRAGQEEVCRAVTQGRDSLLVMPTGAGKSLCYQLPGLARGGATLVISPLIALMEDQVAKLESVGVRVARIHSGLSRDNARQACRLYLDGELDFLFIAPERLRVDGFVPMLAKRLPTLIAVDEAHCISQWGHDFRADYRMLGRHVAALRPSPVIALTATATPQVQRDIVMQLGLISAEQFIHGFRRDNLGVEVVEVPKPQRIDLVTRVLEPHERRPAIVYTASRKDAEAFATTLNKTFRAAAYHAGMGADQRSRVQKEFLGGSLDVVVATIAFGMGVDKADVRTVVHAALPGTLEGYYQEIGRAGRDGEPARAVMMHSFADQKMQQFFIEQDYPPADDVAKVQRLLTDKPQDISQLKRASRLDDDVVASAVERLLGHGGAIVTASGGICRGATTWRNGYEAHVAMRHQQMQQVVRFTQQHGCRMAMLVRHFGDIEDARIDCGVCDWCNPGEALLQETRTLTTTECQVLRDAVALLRSRETSTGKLQQEIPGAGRMQRSEWEALLLAACRAGILFCEESGFIKDGQTIRYRKVSLGTAGIRWTPSSGLADLRISCPRDRAGASDGKLSRGEAPSSATGHAPKPRREKPSSPVWFGQQKALEQALRAWRLAQARELEQPAFVIFSDALLHALVRDAPTDTAMLRNIPGFGPTKVTRFGADICKLCTKHLLTQA